jgi:hypothetical protein
MQLAALKEGKVNPGKAKVFKPAPKEEDEEVNIDKIINEATEPTEESILK